MTDKPGDHPLPHPGLLTQTPLIFTVKMGDVLYRHYEAAFDRFILALKAITASTIPIALQVMPSA